MLHRILSQCSRGISVTILRIVSRTQIHCGKNGVLLNVKGGGTCSLPSLHTHTHTHTRGKIFIFINIYRMSINSGLTGKTTRQQSSIDVPLTNGTPWGRAQCKISSRCNVSSSRRGSSFTVVKRCVARYGIQVTLTDPRRKNVWA